MNRGWGFSTCLVWPSEDPTHLLVLPSWVLLVSCEPTKGVSGAPQDTERWFAV